MSTTHRCGSTATDSGEPCRQPVAESGETCHRHPDPDVPEYASELTDKQRRFVEEYTTDFNATQAAIRAGYSAKTASQLGYQLLQKPSVDRAVKKRLADLAMGPDEALMRLAEWGRADIGEFIEVTEDGDFRLDLTAAHEAGKLFLVRELSYDRDGRPKIKMYDAKDAVKQIAKAHGLFIDRVEHTGLEGGPIETRVDLSQLEDDELRLLKQLQQRARVAVNGAGSDEPA